MPTVSFITCPARDALVPLSKGHLTEPRKARFLLPHWQERYSWKSERGKPASLTSPSSASETKAVYPSRLVGSYVFSPLAGSDHEHQCTRIERPFGRGTPGEHAVAPPGQPGTRSPCHRPRDRPDPSGPDRD